MDRTARLRELLAQNEEIHRKMKWLYEQGEEEEFFKLNDQFMANAKQINAGLADA